MKSRSKVADVAGVVGDSSLSPEECAGEYVLRRCGGCELLEGATEGKGEGESDESCDRRD